MRHSVTRDSSRAERESCRMHGRMIRAHEQHDAYANIRQRALLYTGFVLVRITGMENGF